MIIKITVFVSVFGRGQFFGQFHGIVIRHKSLIVSVSSAFGQTTRPQPKFFQVESYGFNIKDLSQYQDFRELAKKSDQIQKLATTLAIFNCQFQVKRCEEKI